MKHSRWEWHPPAGTWPSCAAFAASAAAAAAAGGCKQAVRGAGRGGLLLREYPGQPGHSPVLVGIFAFPPLLQLAGAALALAGGFLRQHLAGGVRGDADPQAEDAFLLFYLLPTQKPGRRRGGSGSQAGRDGSILHPALWPPLGRDSPAFVAVEGVEEVGAALGDGGARELRDRGAGRAQCPLWLCKIQTDGGTRTPAFGSCPRSGREGRSRGLAGATRVWRCRPRQHALV